MGNGKRSQNKRGQDIRQGKGRLKRLLQNPPVAEQDALKGCYSAGRALGQK